ncbi:MAG: hypothetical protein HZA83_01500 [Thaumarchaeota archaeon]|nr:hypothetical protein [Nitrososphaerota archaeon]
MNLNNQILGAGIQSMPIFYGIEHIRTLAEAAEKGNGSNPEVRDLSIYWEDYMDSQAWRWYKGPIGNLCDKLVEYLTDPAGTEGRYDADVIRDIKALEWYIRNPSAYKRVNSPTVGELRILEQEDRVSIYNTPLAGHAIALFEIMEKARSQSMGSSGKKAPDFDAQGNVKEKIEYLKKNDYAEAYDLEKYLATGTWNKNDYFANLNVLNALEWILRDPAGCKTSNPDWFPKPVRGTGPQLWTDKQTRDEAKSRLNKIEIRKRKEEEKRLEAARIEEQKRQKEIERNKQAEAEQKRQQEIQSKIKNMDGTKIFGVLAVIVAGLFLLRVLLRGSDGSGSGTSTPSTKTIEVKPQNPLPMVIAQKVEVVKVPLEDIIEQTNRALDELSNKKKTGGS